MKTIKKLLVANRGEIAIRIFRAATELHIPTVAIYSKEDKGALHRYKADEAYLIEGASPSECYLDIEAIIETAKSCGANAIHPGYGFLSENRQFAQRCSQEDIIFIGPEVRHLDMFGDKIKARNTAIQAGLPVIPGTKDAINNVEEAKQFARDKYPVMIKALSGGGGKGMRIVRNAEELEEAISRAQSEAMKSFGSSEIYIEQYIDAPKHIEVQIIGDKYGNIVHLFERDCSIQRRHQKVVEVAPSVGLSDTVRTNICNAAVDLMQQISYVNAGTVEFLVQGEDFYFIEVNPRVQVEHTITEMVTGIDIVKAQLLIADGAKLSDERIAIPPQQEIVTHGYAIQCRITTEDPANNFLPDTGRITAYRSSGGFGVRLDADDGFQGAEISPYYDSLLVKLSTHALTFKQAEEKMVRSLKEMRIRGIKTNLQFLMNVVQHPDFIKGNYNTRFLELYPELFDIKAPKDRGTKTLAYIADITVNGFPGINKTEKPRFELPHMERDKTTGLSGTKQLLDVHGASYVSEWIKAQQEVLITDTTFRDAHQSLLATRVRTKDMLAVASQTNQYLIDSFSLEMWGGATFDVAYNFLKEDPWERLRKLRTAIPNVLFQMLLRASNAVGYKNYPDNVVQQFIRAASDNGIDVFRIFDSLNWLDQMKVANEAVLKAGKISEGAICYTGDILNPKRSDVYTLDYYLKMAKAMEQEGFHILAIKDMAGLLKPEAAYILIQALKAEVSLPIHLHTHDTSGNGIMTYNRAIDAGVDIIDTAISSMSGLTSQPSLNSLYYSLEGKDRQLRTNIEGVEALSHYWSTVRKFYHNFESDIQSPNTEIYQHEMPGGQYSNIEQQAKSLGLGDQFEAVKDMYKRVNMMFGDIVKVTPSSKVVGDMALYMVQNNLDEQTVIERGESLDFPDSVVSFFKGEIGQPANGFPKRLQSAVLKGQKSLTVRPGETLAHVDFDELEHVLTNQFEHVTEEDVLSYALYPKVFEAYKETEACYGNISLLDTPTFFYGMRKNETVEIKIDAGKTLIVTLLSIGHVHDDGYRTLYFELNGMPRQVRVKDNAAEVSDNTLLKADRKNNKQIGAQMPGTVGEIKVSAGAHVRAGQTLMITEAMKMETSVQAPVDAVVKHIHVSSGMSIQTGDLLIEFE
ncbi:pyruvate carboxylase [Macrococcoides canis]|uniref:pyruvate carboxylase n=1 Tax=Macrococcoides canis TaxID=1855823 RepID=UPI00105C1A1F|nr:pyruvate carboxylase [Macrococcus canis]TDM32510.1 pyruvate carboxylase [Macrococcus canis]